MLADIEVVAFDLGLRVLDRLVDHARLDGHVILDAQAVHDAADALAAETAHEIVFHAQVEAALARIAQAAGAATQLVVDAARFVAFGADDVEAALGDAHVHDCCRSPPTFRPGHCAQLVL